MSVHAAEIGHRGASPATRTRVQAVDTLRGLVMIIMALDHTRDFVHAAAMAFQPEDLTQTTPAIFMTRWITHVCAPCSCSAPAPARSSGSSGAAADPSSPGSWIGVMAAGFCFGRVYRLPAERRRTVLLRLGLALIAAFFVIRALNVYGDPRPWSLSATWSRRCCRS